MMRVKTVHLQYFAILRDQRGQTNETLETSSATAENLFSELSIRYRFSLKSDRVKVAINEEFAPWNTELKDGDRVVFIPPVAGG